ncbi:MAG: hypothetical protein IJY74_06335 [Oscillospiraceae bacterium]|nr:hypothetical protein [Oscillospiraceae bacterium]
MYSGFVLAAAAGCVLIAMACSKLDPQPNSPEGWIIFFLVMLLTLFIVFGARFVSAIIASSYSVFTVYQNELITITPLAEVAFKQCRIKNTRNAGKAFVRIGVVMRFMQELAERYDFEDLFLNNDFCFYYSGTLKKIRSVRRFGKYTVLRCRVLKFDSIAKKQTERSCTFYIDKVGFENSEELISVLSSRLRLGQ